MIVTFWPSSRRLAISPPQERATSSGWGATNTWVMAGRVYRANPGASTVTEASRPRRRAARTRPAPSFRLDPLVAVRGSTTSRSWRSRGPTGSTSRPPAGSQLLAQRRRGSAAPPPRRGSRATARPPARRRSRRPTRTSTASAVARARRAAPGPRPRAPGCRSIVMTAAADRREHGRLVAGAGPDLEHPVARPDAEQLGHPGDDVRLADRLAGRDRQRLVGVGEAALARRDERLARHRGHRREDALVRDARAGAAGARPSARARRWSGPDHPGRRTRSSGRGSHGPAAGARRMHVATMSFGGSLSPTNSNETKRRAGRANGRCRDVVVPRRVAEAPDRFLYAGTTRWTPTSPR